MRLGFASTSFGHAFAILIAALTISLPLQTARADVEVDMVPGVNLYGGDIQRIPLGTGDPGLCRQACDQNGQCRGWTFIKPGIQDRNGTCWLKGALPQQGTPDQNAISGVRPNNGGPAPGNARTDFSMMFGVDFNGADLQSFALPRGDPALCQQACDGNGQCQAWTFIKPGPQGPPICWLKRAVPQPVFAQHLISGTRSGPRTPGGPPGGPVTGTPGGATGTGTEWGVWASASGGRWNDPCAILYNAAQVANNRYDGNPGYRRVRTRATQREADLDIDQFGLHHRNQPDGIVKMVPCNPAGGQPTTTATPGTTQQNATQWMTGRFSSNFGAMMLSPGGGTYDYEGGTISVTRINGAVMESIWRQTTPGNCGGGKEHFGRFAFTFTANGFSGTWGHCDGPLNQGSWSGTRQ